jgi:DNA-binding transcriptional ArsR family regulator
MLPERRVLVVDLTIAEPLRETVGPIAWTVLESLAASATPGTRQHRVGGGTRALGRSLSLSKDTVARALRRLAEVRLVERVDARDPTSGRFGSTSYVVDLVAAGISIERRVDRIDVPVELAPIPPHRAELSPPGPLTLRRDRQLTLLD